MAKNHVPDNRTSDATVAASLSAAGRAALALDTDDLDLAERGLRRAVELAEEAREPELQAGVTIALSRVLWRRGHFDESVRQLYCARDLFLAAGASSKAQDIDDYLSQTSWPDDEDSDACDGAQTEESDDISETCARPDILSSLNEVASLLANRRPDAARTRLHQILSELRNSIATTASQDVRSLPPDRLPTAVEASQLFERLPGQILDSASACAGFSDALAERTLISSTTATDDEFETPNQRRRTAPEEPDTDEVISCPLYSHAELLAEHRRPAEALEAIERIRANLARFGLDAQPLVADLEQRCREMLRRTN